MPAPFPEGVPGTGTHSRHSNHSLLEPSATQATRHQPDLQMCHLQLSHSEAATGSWPPCVSDPRTPARGTPWGLLSNHPVLSWHTASHNPPTTTDDHTEAWGVSGACRQSTRLARRRNWSQTWAFLALACVHPTNLYWRSTEGQALL